MPAGSPFELVVLGSSGTHPSAGRVCSGYLLRTPDTRVMLDCGNGSLSNLFLVSSLPELDAVVLSHAHHDHCADLIGLYYAYHYSPDVEGPLDVYAPPGTGEHLAQLLSEDSREAFLDLFRFSDVAGGHAVTVGDLDLTFHRSVHAVEAVSIRAEHDGAVVTYSGDTAGGPDLVAAAKDADLFLCEASWVGRPEDWPEDLHLTATGAGQVAKEAGVKRLVLTHLWPTNDRMIARAEASAAFGGPVEFAEDRAVLEVRS